MEICKPSWYKKSLGRPSCGFWVDRIILHLFSVIKPYATIYSCNNPVVVHMESFTPWPDMWSADKLPDEWSSVWIIFTVGWIVSIVMLSLESWCWWFCSIVHRDRPKPLHFGNINKYAQRSSSAPGILCWCSTARYLLVAIYGHQPNGTGRPLFEICIYMMRIQFAWSTNSVHLM